MRWMLALLLAVTLTGCLGESKTKLLRNDDKAAFPNIGPVTIGFDNIEDRMVVLLPKTFKTSGVVLDDKTASTISIGLIGRLGINNPYASAARYNPLVVEMDAKSGYYYFIVLADTKDNKYYLVNSDNIKKTELKFREDLIKQIELLFKDSNIKYKELSVKKASSSDVERHVSPKYQLLLSELLGDGPTQEEMREAIQQKIKSIVGVARAGNQSCETMGNRPGPLSSLSALACLFGSAGKWAFDQMDIENIKVKKIRCVRTESSLFYCEYFSNYLGNNAKLAGPSVDITSLAVSRALFRRQGAGWSVERYK